MSLFRATNKMAEILLVTYREMLLVAHKKSRFTESLSFNCAHCRTVYAFCVYSTNYTHKISKIVRK